MQSAYLVNIQAVVDPVPQHIEGLPILLRTQVVNLGLNGPTIGTQMTGFLPEDVLRPREAALQEVVGDLKG